MSSYQDMPIAKALNAGIAKAMQKDPKVLMFGEDIAELGGVFRVTEGLLAEFGRERGFQHPDCRIGNRWNSHWSCDAWLPPSS